ncbi:putative metallopeptidase family m24 protein [Golovinomyces cichoracearum]|uniref:Putative metallopeptidase family m24 protein n=1 Tax=Golovinomyces cichoracearum TaxID=62708 RepID=A0A420JAL1_9PEZI|nr:putative metallopeptidase family m24 protein [Golovinomyces cichoracearum]
MDPQYVSESGVLASSDNMDVFRHSPIAALKLLCAGIEALIKLSGDIAPTIPMYDKSSINLDLELEKVDRSQISSPEELKDWEFLPKQHRGSVSNEEPDVNGVKLRTELNENLASNDPFFVVDDTSELAKSQYSVIARKFYSKYMPPISLVDYLMRIHRFCPMSTAVYLATSLYIHKLAIDEKTISVTRRNCHRLVLAGLRVTMKALEDHSYAHAHFAKVGGVSVSELAKLEISFCFLINFEFIKSGEMLVQHACDLKMISSLQGGMNYLPKTPTKLRDRTNISAKNSLSLQTSVATTG